MYSVNANNGDMTLRVNFDVATDPNIDQILAQLRVSQATSQLPADVNNYGVTVQKSTSAPLMLVALYSPKQTYDGIFLANYAHRARRPNLQRQGPAQWKTLRDPGALSASRQQRDRRGQRSKKIDGGIEATFSGGHGLRRLA
jgi:hypothetical protein